MNKINVSTPSTTVLSQYPGYNAGDQYLTQIATFTIWCDTSLSGTANIVLPGTAAFRLGTANFKIFDVAGQAGTNNVVVSIEDGSLINGAATIVLGTNFGNLSIQLQDAEWFGNLNGTGGGGGGITGARNGVFANGDFVELGSSSVSINPLIRNSIIGGLDSYYTLFSTTVDSSFVLEFGNLVSLQGAGKDKSFFMQSSTSDQVFTLSMFKNNAITLSNTDIAAGSSRSISLLSSDEVGGTGAVSIANSTDDGYSLSIAMRDRNMEFSVLNSALSSGNKQVTRFDLIDTGAYLTKYVDNTNSNSLVNGYTFGKSVDVSAIFWHSTKATIGGNLDGTVLQLNTNGLTFMVASAVQFLVSPSGEVATNLPTYANDAAAGAGGLTTGMLYRISSTTPANLIAAKI